ncbi:MAG: FkbM family methyltransferase [Sphingobacteriales bacterium]|nr:MAG: FkbM family methyltransferase [Sphingobacteriales bacterium]
MQIKKIFKQIEAIFGICVHRNKKLNLELYRLQKLPLFKAGYTNILGKPFKFNNGQSFAVTYKEIFIDGIYEFKPTGVANKILDCGANMGVSVVYFALKYPNHQIIAFEPEKAIFDILKENVESFGLKNVILFQKAVWVKNEQLEFYSDGGMGGRVNNQYKNQTPTIVEAVPLLDYLKEDVDFLKIDIEGAEVEVLKYCGEGLKKAKNIFFEYHNDVTKKQTLHELLELVVENGFHYYIKESGTRNKPFIEDTLICEKFDMAINIFCYMEN